MTRRRVGRGCSAIIGITVGAATLVACSTGQGPVTRRDTAPGAPTQLASKGNDTGRSYKVLGETYRIMPTAKGFSQEGIASWYGRKFHGRRTSNGERYDMYALTAAHRSLPLPTSVRVENLRNGRHVVVRVNDRGPFKDNRVIDLSYAAASELGMLQAGTAPVRITALPAKEEVPVSATTEPPSRDAVSARSAEPKAAQSRQPPAAPSQPAPRYYVQAGAFGERANARRLAERLQETELSAPTAVYPGTVEAKRYYRVRVGPMRRVARVDRVTQELDASGFADSHVVITEPGAPGELP